MFYLFRTGIFDLILPDRLFTYGGWIIPSIFLLRAVGDFKYVGFFKKIKQTAFAKADTRFYTPLCLVIAALGFLNQWLG